MIGVFLKNEDGRLCFVQPTQENPSVIKEFHYFEHNHTVSVIMPDGHEEMFTTEIGPEIRKGFLTEKEILVVDLDVNEQVEKEYKVTLSKFD